MKGLVTTIVLALLSAGLFACGGGDDSTATTTTAAATTAPSTTSTTSKLPLMDDGVGDPHVRYAADPSGKLAYFITEASASAGKATIQFVNPQSVRHNVTIESPSGKTIGATKTIGRGKTSTTVMLKTGVYRVYCSVPGHRKAGMQGHLTVYPE